MTPRARSLLLLAVCLAWCSGGSRTAAQEKKETAKQKDAVLANLKKADLARATLIETKNYLVATTLPREKAAALGVLLEKVAPLARKGAQLEEKEEPWKGRLAVYVLPENRDFKSFIRNVVVDQPGGAHVDVRSDNPLVVDPVELPGKATEADQFANTATIVASAYLTGKAGTAKLPAWLTDGFGRVTVYRAEGTNSRRYRAHRLAARNAALGGKGSAPGKITDLWAEERPENADAIANSLAEYLAYGPGKANFAKLIAGFRPNENGTIPTPAQAFESAGWKDIPALEAAWRKWVAAGK